MSNPVHENLTREEARERAGLLSDLAYEVALDLTTGDEEFQCEATITFAARAGADSFVDLTANEVHEVVLNGTPVPADDIAPTRIVLRDLAEQNTLVVGATMAYQHTGKGLHFFRDPSDDAVYLHSQFEPFDAHLMYPCFDQPDIKATFEFAVHAREGWVVVSNETCVEQPEEGAAGRWVFAPTQLLPPYITAVVAGEYTSEHATHGDVDLGFHIRRSLLDHLDLDELVELTGQGLDWFNENFGIAYPFGKYDQVFVPEFFAGAMENAGCVTFSEAYVFRSRVTDAQYESRASTLLHEMAHMWFGDLVTMRWWDDLWLKESFATFCGTLSQVEATRFTEAWTTFLDAGKAWAKMQDQLPTTHPIAADMVDVESVHQNFDGITYAKGASVLRQLVAYVGQDDFLAGCRGYFDAHQYGNGELQDFLRALEKASGRELSSWSKEWLETAGLNTLALSYDIDDDGNLRDVVVEQTADATHPTLRTHRAAIGVYDRDGDAFERIQRVELDITGERTSVRDLDGTPAGAFLLPNDDDLTFAKIRLDERSMDALIADLDLLADSLPRALAWSATWDMVRDAELAASGYVDLIVENAASESQVGVAQRLALRAQGAAERYAAPEHRAGLRSRLAVNALDALNAATPGSDLQHVWTRHFASTAHDPDHLERVAALLDGSWTVEGLEVDVDLRWHLLTALAREGVATDDRIAEELERDQTDLGERHALTARAAMPDPEQKAAAWRRLLTDEELSHTLARQIWSGFQQFTQPELLAEYEDAYLESLAEVWETRPLEWALEFTEGMFPHPTMSAGLQSKVEELLESELPGPLRRTLLEQHDLLIRSMRARAHDAD